MIAPRQQHASAELLEHYREIAPSTLGHFGDQGYLRGIKPLFGNVRMLGNVVTVKVFPPDGSILRDALLLSQAGDVLVIECAGDEECACWGELRTLAGLIKGLAGVVVGGAVTDAAALREHRLPVFSFGVSAYTTRGIGLRGEVNGTVEVAGVRISPGDIALGDDDGVFILDAVRAETLLPDMMAKEALDRERRGEFLNRLKAIDNLHSD
ncbi:RraA family protein [Pseudomonas fluorescens]|uniref:RraA family protein n=1 Tax=Pseudomonas fluorescens TaxID=294 RepID=UPI00259B7A30|nr:RraA family protein [Pseudomonas fluorescens]WJK07240.1 RraA family protein [Pseudomonas fluorescens]